MTQNTDNFSITRHWMTGMDMKQLSIVLLIGVLSAAGCAQKGPSKQDLHNREVSDLRLQIKQVQQDCDQSKARLSSVHEDALTEQETILDAEKERYAALAAELQELKGNVDKRQSGIQQLFFGGDINYVVAPAGFADYRAALRYRSLNDPDFEDVFKEWENKRGGDAAVLRVLQEIDFNQDQLITREEVKAFMKVEKNANSSD